MNKYLSILFFVCVWLTCMGQKDQTIFILDSSFNLENPNHVTFKPSIVNGFVFYHLENLDKLNNEGTSLMMDKDFQRFVWAYTDISKFNKDFNEVCDFYCIEWGTEESLYYMPTLIRAACPDCELPNELKK